MEPFKNKFNKNYITKLASEIKKVYKKFDDKSFKKEINSSLEKLEMKDRVRLISSVMQSYLPKDYAKAIPILIKISTTDKKGNTPITGFDSWPLNQYVEDYGLDHYDVSMQAMHHFTTLFSSEFAIRPYLIQNDKKVFKDLKKWSKDKNYHVRRLVSEGTRPHLPWGLKVSAVHANLERNLNLILPLKDDSHEYVRRSVANHLNDISHLDEALFIKTIKSIKMDSDERKWLVRHACRTLLKKGHPQILKLFGFNPKVKLKLTSKLSPKKITEGDSIHLDINLKGESNKDEKIILEYIIDYPKKNGKYSPKAFRLKETTLKKNEMLKFLKKIHFKAVTTRKHYPGKHFIRIQVNGAVLQEHSFTLK